jgi:NitT/TauT family transport system ATP-binding protein
MSDRVIVMTHRPGRIKRIVDIDLPRPRSSESIEDKAFGDYVGMIWHDLREEAARHMAESETGERKYA